MEVEEEEWIHRSMGGGGGVQAAVFCRRLSRDWKLMNGSLHILYVKVVKAFVHTLESFRYSNSHTSRSVNIITEEFLPWFTGVKVNLLLVYHLLQQ